MRNTPYETMRAHLDTFGRNESPDTACPHCSREVEHGDTECRVCGYNLVRTLVVICAWCADGRALTEAARDNGYDVSHSMCPVCVQRWERDAAGRVVAPKQQPIADRPLGPWTQNGGSDVSR